MEKLELDARLEEMGADPKVINHPLFEKSGILGAIVREIDLEKYFDDAVDISIDSNNNIVVRTSGNKDDNFELYIYVNDRDKLRREGYYKEETIKSLLNSVEVSYVRKDKKDVVESKHMVIFNTDDDVLRISSAYRDYKAIPVFVEREKKDYDSTGIQVGYQQEYGTKQMSPTKIKGLNALNFHEEEDFGILGEIFDNIDYQCELRRDGYDYAGCMISAPQEGFIYKGIVPLDNRRLTEMVSIYPIHNYTDGYVQNYFKMPYFENKDEEAVLKDIAKTNCTDIQRERLMQLATNASSRKFNPYDYDFKFKNGLGEYYDKNSLANKNGRER